MTPESELLMRPHDTTNETSYGYCHCGCGEKTKIATYNYPRYGHVKGQPIRYINGHVLRQAMPERFWCNVNRRDPDDCWEWQGTRSTKGYGLIGMGSKDTGDYRKAIASRISWELHFGPIPEGLLVCHKCDNPPCVNPNHLFLGTHQDNLLDMSAKGRASTPTAKLTKEQVLEIRQLFADGMTQADISRRFQMRREAIYKIVRGLRWKHI